MRKRILIVDDDKPYVEKLKAILGGKYDISFAYNGEEALAKLKTVTPNLIILDIIMPKMDGLEFFDRITPLHSPPVYPVLVITVRANLRELFANLPVEGFIAKPFEMETLLAKLQEIFDRQDKLLTSDRYKGPKKILIVDDNLEHLEKIAPWFLNREITVASTRTSSGAMARIVGTELPDLVLIRSGMPGHPERTISYHLKGMPEARHVVIIVYTDSYRDADVQTESEILSTVGSNNFLELNSIGRFFSRCEQVLQLGPT